MKSLLKKNLFIFLFAMILFAGCGAKEEVLKEEQAEVI